MEALEHARGIAQMRQPHGQRAKARVRLSAIHAIGADTTNAKAARRRPSLVRLFRPAQSFMPLSAECTSSPPATLMPIASTASLCQFFCASRVTYGRIAAEIACDEVCGTAPGMLVTQKCVTPSTT